MNKGLIHDGLLIFVVFFFFFVGHRHLKMSLLAKRFLNSRIITCRSKSTVLTSLTQDDVDFAKEYSEVPGPKSLPLLGNSWRFMSFIGMF